MLEVLGVLGVILGLAYLIETLVEATVGEALNHIPAAAQYKWLLRYVAVAVGIAGALVYQFDLIHLLARVSEVSTIPVTVYGMVITGIAIGQGAAYLHQYISVYFPASREGRSGGGVQADLPY